MTLSARQAGGGGPAAPEPREPAGWLDRWLAAHEDDVVAVRRHLHANPELGFGEFQTTELVRSRLASAGLRPWVLPGGVGLTCDIPGERDDVTVALRADIDALPLQDTKTVPYRSTVPGVCHACGHDAHTAILLGTGLALAAGPRPPHRVRLLFQPAEERMPGGALDSIAAGVLEGVDMIFALHCDPRLPSGQVGLRVGAITSASDRVEVRIHGPGGHTSRPHLTADLVYAMGRIIADVPALLSRVVDPRHGTSLVWGMVRAGTAPNAIPQSGVLRGTVRVLDRAGWDRAPDVVRRLVAEVAAPTGTVVEVDYTRGVPPVVNDRRATALLRGAAELAVGRDAVVDVDQSLGGEDFAWYLDTVPGSLARLGVLRPGAEPLDLHQPGFDIDEAALAVGVRVLVGVAHAPPG